MHFMILLRETKNILMKMLFSNFNIIFYFTCSNIFNVKKQLMKKISTFLRPVIAACVTVVLFSCNSGGDEKNDKKGMDSTTAAKPDTKPAAGPIKLMMIQHKVNDFKKWKAAYLAHDSMRNVYGISKFRIARMLDDSNMVIVMDIINDVQKAKEFAASPGLKTAMQNAGVSGQPSISYIEMARGDTSMIPQRERMMVAHKVKDFNVWIKAFDSEGTTTRASFGLIDKAIGRGTDDPNMEYVIFGISDMAKAKARGQSPELKKLMQDAGVMPETVKQLAYRLVD